MTVRSEKILRRLGLVLAGAALAYWLYVTAAVLLSSPERRVMFISDDAYYYLQLARSFATTGLWSFDGGVSLTTGFHPLHAWVLTGIYAVVRPGPELFVSLAAVLTCLAFVPALVIGFLFAWRSARLTPFLLLALFLLSRNVCMNALSAMEWSWVVSLAALYCVVFAQPAGRRGRRAAALLFLCGFAGSLARSDFGLLPACLAAAAVVGLRSRGGRRLALRAAAGLAGACAGVLATFLHNELFTGEFLQSSARMKLLWLEAYDTMFVPILIKVLSLFGKDFSTVILVSALTAVALFAGVPHVLPGWRGLFARKPAPLSEREAARNALWCGAVLTVAGYLVFYARNPAGVQTWYTANVVVPLFLLIALPVVDTPVAVLREVAAVMAGALLCLRVVTTPIGIPPAEWPHQVYMYRAGHYLREAPLEGRVGAWNAGIIGYYSGGRVINLDGLVNNDIFPYAARNAVPEYVDKLGIRYIIDFERMLASSVYRRRGGYDDPEFVARARPLRVFDNSARGWRRLTLYHVRPPRALRRRPTESACP